MLYCVHVHGWGHIGLIRFFCASRPSPHVVLAMHVPNAKCMAILRSLQKLIQYSGDAVEKASPYHAFKKQPSTNTWSHAGTCPCAGGPGRGGPGGHSPPGDRRFP